MRRLAIVLALVALGACSTGGPSVTPVTSGSAPGTTVDLAAQTLTRIATTFAYSKGTISIVNASGRTQDLSKIVLRFDDADPIASVWGTPWMAWQIAQSGGRYTLTGGTPYANWPNGGTMTVSYSPPWQSKNVPSHVTVYSGTATTPKPSPTPSPKPTATPSPAPSVPPGGREFVGFWESWSDANSSAPFYALTSIPASVTTTDVAFSIANDNTIAPAQNAYPLLPGAKTIHAHGGRLLLSFGGATSQFKITNVAQFVANLQAFQSANPGLYDGFDFDDEVMPWNGQRQLVGVIRGVRAAFPHAVISFDALMSGADPQVTLSTHQGEDVAILQQAGRAIDYVNVMDYDQYGWHPSDHPNCAYAAGAADDCRLDVLRDFANVRMPSGATFPASKIVMGLMIGPADDGSVVSPSDASVYATWIKTHGYRGVMIWDLDRDGPASTGSPKGTYVNAIGTALGT